MRIQHKPESEGIPWKWFWITAAGVVALCAVPVVAPVFGIAVGGTIVWKRGWLSAGQLVTTFFLLPFFASASPGVIIPWVVTIGLLVSRVIAWIAQQRRPKGLENRSVAQLRPAIVPPAIQPGGLLPQPQGEMQTTSATLSGSRFITVNERPAPAKETFTIPIPNAEGEVWQIEVTLETSYSGHASFLEDSKRYRTAQVPRFAKHVPFMTYWPTLQSLNKNQLHWYLWWRNEWEQGRLHETDLSYIFLFVYELLNLCYETNPERSYDKLRKLYGDHRAMQPQLDNYLPHWLGDFAWELGKDSEAADWYRQTFNLVSLAEQIQPPERRTALFNTFVHKSSYSPTVYFKQHGEQFLSFIGPHLEVLDDLSRTETGQPIIDMLNDGQPYARHTLEHQPYAGAVLARKVRIRPLVQQWPGGWESPAYVRMGSVVRCLENFHRMSTGNTRLLKPDVSTLPPVVRQYLDELALRFVPAGPSQRGKRTKPGKTTVESPSPQVDQIPRPVTFDPNLVRQLHAESEELSNLLSEAMREQSQSLEGSPAQVPAIVPTPPDLAHQPPSGTPSGSTSTADLASLFQSTNTEDFEAFWSDLDPRYRGLLALFPVDGAVPKAQAMQAAKQQGLMLAAVVDEINQLAVDTMGDRLIEETEEALVIGADFQEVLSKTLHK